ncbi:hypothetical protein B0I37DRAFT_192253 [Chaetomium sp. MPI-CAGE-AT-0009]|nr:hypothetical protein B0I37DRAFT_192253 [Chaetomium sp. MPI-CAGE-AT-0009]
MAIWGRPVGHQAPPPVRREEEAENTRRKYLWNTPDGDKPDFAETYTHGDEVVFSWNALNNSIYDLWLTSWKPGPDPVAVCLARAVNLAQDGNLKLVTSDPPTAQLANETRYVLRFKPPTGRGEFVASDPDLSSPAFLLVEPAFHQQDVPSATAPATTTRSRVTPARETATTALESDGPVSDMSPAAATGLTIGLILMVVFLVAAEVGYLMWRRKRRRGEGQDGTPASSRRKMKWFGKGDGGVFVQVDKAEMVIDDSIWMSPELPGDSTWGQRLVHELQGSRLGRGNPLGRPMTINSSVVELDVGRV